MSLNNVEEIVISKIVSERSIVPFLDNGITAEFFAQERWKLAWTWAYNYWSTHGEVPNEAAFARQFPSYDLEEADEPTSALIDELIAKRKRFLVQGGLEAAVTAFDAKDVDEALSSVSKMLAVVSTETARTDITRSSVVISDIVKEILSVKNIGLLGIPTGFPTIDEATGGLQPEQLVGIIALPKHGKSTVALSIAMAAQRVGKRGGIVTFEMSGTEMYQRYVSLGAHVSLTSILRGRLTVQDKDAIRAFEEEILDLEDIVMIHDTTTTRTVGGIVAKMEQIGNLDYLIIDGVYMMDDELGEDSGTPRALTNISRSLKRTAQRKKLPIIFTTQALLARTSKKSGIQLGSIGYTSAFAQDSDAIIGLDREDLSQPTATLKIVAARNALGATADLRFDYGMGVIEESGGYAFAGSGMGDAVDDGD